MYLTATLSENTMLTYADQYSLSDMPSLHTYWCGACNLDFTSSDAETCPYCGSDDVHREH